MLALAATGFGAISVLAKLGYAAGAEPASLLCSRVVVGAAALAPAVALAGRPSPRELALAGAAGAAFAAAGFLEFEALALLPAPTLVVLLFLAPVWVAIASRRRLGLRGVTMLALVLAGVALLAGVSGGGAIDPLGAALAVAASQLYAAVFLLLERLVHASGPVAATALAVSAAAVVALAVEPSGAVTELGDPATRSYALAVGALTAASLLLLAGGMRNATAFAASVVTAIEPLTAALLSWAFLGEVLTPTQIAGAVAVVCGAAGVSRT